jgi:hypothetical protein
MGVIWLIVGICVYLALGGMTYIFGRRLLRPDARYLISSPRAIRNTVLLWPIVGTLGFPILMHRMRTQPFEFYHETYTQ